MFLEKIEQNCQKADARHIIEGIVGASELSNEEKVKELISLANFWFETDFALVSSIEEDIYTILFSASEIAPADPGMQFKLGDTYCVKTLEARGPVAYHSAGSSDIAAHPCYNVFRLETYIGAPVFQNGAVVGTVNFTRESKHPKFTEEDLRLVEKIAECVGQLVDFRDIKNRILGV